MLITTSCLQTNEQLEQSRSLSWVFFPPGSDCTETILPSLPRDLHQYPTHPISKRVLTQGGRKATFLVDHAASQGRCQATASAADRIQNFKGVAMSLLVWDS